MILRIVVGLTLTVAAFAVAGRRLWWLKRLAMSGQPAPERVAVCQVPSRPRGGNPAGRGNRPAEAAQVVGPRRGPCRDVLGVHRAAADDHRGVRGAVLAHLRDPWHRALGSDRVPGGPVRGRGAGRHHHVHGHPAAQRPAQGRPPVAVLRLAHPRRLGGARHDRRGHRHAAYLPGGAAEHRGVPLPARVGVRVLGGSADRCIPSGTASTACWRWSSSSRSWGWCWRFWWW